MSDRIEIMDPYEDCPWLPARELYRRLGFEPLPPSAVDDFQLRGRLWEFIYALAGRRIYLGNTNRLSDRELYVWLHEEWFEHEIADVPPEAEWNCRITPAEPTGGKREDGIWLRYYADDATRRRPAADFPEDPVPPREDPRFDRDRWLPEPPLPRGAGDAPEPELPSPEAEPGDLADPLGLQSIDEEIGGAEPPEDIARITTDLEPENWKRPIDELQRTGPTLLPPDELTDEALTAKLWELLHNLACRGFYVLCTDHLSEREVYSELWTRGLREEAMLPGKCKAGGFFYDFIGSGNEEDTALWLRFYASDAIRAKWGKDWPETPVPPKEKPPYNRDWRLPKGPF